MQSRLHILCFVVRSILRPGLSSGAQYIDYHLQQQGRNEGVAERANPYGRYQPQMAYSQVGG